MATTRKKTIEANLNALEKIFLKFETGDMGIDQSIKEYAKASKLVEKIHAHLEAYEMKIKEIKNKK